MSIKDLRIGDIFRDNTGFKFVCVGIFSDGTVYGDFDGNEGDVWEFSIDEIEKCE